MLTNMQLLFALLSIATFFGFTHQQSSGGCDCGLPNRRTRIVGGVTTEIGEYPWMCELIKVTRNNVTNQIIANESACGATLISNQYVITAAHCVFNRPASEYIIDLGDQDLSTGNEVTNQYVDVISILTNPEYNTRTHSNDIAILKLARSVAYTSNIKPICIPPPALNVSGTSLVVTGWGTLYNNGPVSDTLQEVTLPVLASYKCKANYSTTPNAVIDDTVICTQYTGTVRQDACQGDSGGPAAVECGGRYMLAGIVSYSIGCANVPGVYTNVSHYRQWIVDNTPAYSLCGYDCYPSPTPPPPVKTCGVANSVSSSGKRKRVIGGSVTGPNKYPWAVGIYVLNSFKNSTIFTCGATLISNQWVLTAAKCIYNLALSDLEIVLGDYDQNNLKEAGEITASVASYSIHPNYSNVLSTNNIALIKLSSVVKVGLNTPVFPICLPTPSSVPTDFSPLTTLLFIGWGIDQTGNYPNVLKEATVYVTSIDQCRGVYLSSVTSTTICTTQSSTGAVCTGDKGGPFMLQDNGNTYYQVALQSLQSKSICDVQKTNPDPAGNLAIGPYMSWITSVSGVQPVSPVGQLE